MGIGSLIGGIAGGMFGPIGIPIGMGLGYLADKKGYGNIAAATGIAAAGTGNIPLAAMYGVDQYMTQYNYNQRLKDQERFAKRSAGWRVEDLRNHGINPISAQGASQPYLTHNVRKELTELGLEAGRSDNYGKALTNRAQELANIGMELDLKDRIRGKTFGVEKSVSLYNVIEQPFTGKWGGWHFGFTQDVSESAESDDWLRREAFLIKTLYKIEGFGDVSMEQREILKRLQYAIQQQSNYSDVTPLWSFNYSMFLNYPKNRTKPGQLFYPEKPSRKKMRFSDEPWEFAP